MMLKLLPIGTVVRLKGAEVPFMIAGISRKMKIPRVSSTITLHSPILWGFLPR